MRQMKFRGKSIETDKWIYGLYSIELITEGDEIIGYKHYIHDESLLHMPPIEIDPETVSQFTGLYDKGGKEIFEGDIVKYYQPYAKRWDIHIVEWDTHLACFALFEQNNKWAKESDWLKILDIEVIGNTYDNPELI